MRVRDFAYLISDERHQGIYPPVPVEEEEDQLEGMDLIDSDEEEEKLSAEVDTTPENEAQNYIDISIFREMHSSHLQNILLPTLAHILHSTPALDDGLKLAFYPARVHSNIVKDGEWEMNARENEYLLVAYRDYQSESLNTSPVTSKKLADCLANQLEAFPEKEMKFFDNTADTFAQDPPTCVSESTASSTTTPNELLSTPLILSPPIKSSRILPTLASNSSVANTSNQVLLPLTLDPDSDMFATHLREFVEYQKVYGEGWVTGFKVVSKIHKLYDIGEWETCKMKLRLTEIGLIQKSMIHSLHK